MEFKTTCTSSILPMKQGSRRNLYISRGRSHGRAIRWVETQRPDDLRLHVWESITKGPAKASASLLDGIDNEGLQETPVRTSTQSSAPGSLQPSEIQ
jgi:hypothetical protein